MEYSGPGPEARESDKLPDLYALLHRGEPLWPVISPSKLPTAIFASRAAIL
jgi:hypothetical protein